MSATLKDIAEAAGVSQMTVSRILNGNGKASPETLRRVKAVVERYGYQPRTGYRKQAAGDYQAAQQKITLLSPYPEYWNAPSEEAAQRRFSGAMRAATEFGGRIETLPVSRNNSPMDIEWNWLKHLGADDNILAFSQWHMIPVMELQRRGCRIAIMMGDLFWRRLYAPQLKGCAAFTLSISNGIVKLVDFLAEKGHKKIAIVMPERYLAEPDFPQAIGYEQGMNLQGLAYRQVIPVNNTAEEFLENIREAYRNDPFDALILEEHYVLDFDFTKSLAANLGLPEKVEIVMSSDRKEYSYFRPRTVRLHRPEEQMAYDAVKLLLSGQFETGESFYECELL